MIENPKIIWWKIYYGNGSTFSSEDGEWNKAPNQDVQVVLLWRADHNTRILFGRDFYWFDLKAKIFTYGQTNILSEAKEQIKTGSYVDDWDFQKILWSALLMERTLYYGDKYPPIPPPDYLLINRGPK